MTHKNAFLALVRGLGAVHLMVGVTLAAPDKVPFWAGPVAAAGLLWATGQHLPRFPPAQQAAWGYLLPLAGCLVLRLFTTAAKDWGAAEAAAGEFLLAIVLKTPPIFNLAVAAYVLTRREKAEPKLMR